MASNDRQHHNQAGQMPHGQATNRTTAVPFIVPPNTKNSPLLSLPGLQTGNGTTQLHYSNSN
jgi:hypothetical protein